MSDNNWVNRLFGLILLIGASMALAKMFAKAVRGVLIEFRSDYFYTGELVVFWTTTVILTVVILKLALSSSEGSAK